VESINQKKPLVRKAKVRPEVIAITGMCITEKAEEV